jgi:hypothetical protein
MPQTIPSDQFGRANSIIHREEFTAEAQSPPTSENKVFTAEALELAEFRKEDFTTEDTEITECL